MLFRKFVALLTISSFVFLVAVGCETETKSNKVTSKKPAEKKDDHDDHDDHPPHGPNGGHIFEAESGDVHVHLEVVIESNDKRVRLVSLDHDNKPAPIAAKEAKINFEGGKEPQVFTFKAENEKDGKATEFVCDDAAVLIAVNTEGGCKIEMKVADKDLVFDYKPSSH